MPLEVDFEVSKAWVIPSVLSLCLLFVDKGVNSQLLQCYVCLPLDIFSALMVMESNPLELSALFLV